MGQSRVGPEGAQCLPGTSWLWDMDGAMGSQICLLIAMEGLGEPRDRGGPGSSLIV